MTSPTAQSDKVAAAVRNLPTPLNSRLWIAYSGGLDSTVLLHASVTEFGSSRCRVLHIDHGINENSRSWARHCRDFATLLGVVIEVEEVAVPTGNIELQSRLLRYEKFRQRLQSGDVLATAHHRDDDAETRLWQFMTGRAPIGIVKSRILGEGTVERPFLSLTKGQLEEYARLHDLSWIEDPSNDDVSFDRNWIRHELLPSIERRIPDVRQRLIQSSHKELPRVERKPLDIPNRGLSSNEVRTWLLAYGANPAGSVVSEIALQSTARADSVPEIRVASFATARRYRDRWFVVPDVSPFEPRKIFSGRNVSFENGRLVWKSSVSGFPPDQELFLTNRGTQPASSFRIRVHNISKTLKALFQENHIPPWLRDGWPLLMLGERIVCIPGIARDSSYFEAKPTIGSVEPQWIPTEG